MRLLVLVTCCGLLMAACGAADDTVRDEGLAAVGAEAVVSPATGDSAGAATAVAAQSGTAIVYFLRYDAPVTTLRRLVDGRSVAESGLRGLLAGPTPAERSLHYATALAKGTRLLGFSVDDRVAIADLSSLPGPLGGRDAEALLALYQVVYTVTANGGIDAVRVRVNGSPYGLNSITGGSSALEPPLTRADLAFVTTETQAGSTGCSVEKEGAVSTTSTPVLEVVRPEEGASITQVIQVRGRLVGKGGPIVIRILQDGFEVTRRIINDQCRGPFSASLPIPRTLAGSVVIEVGSPGRTGERGPLVLRDVTVGR